MKVNKLIWDLPTRLFHWLLVLAFLISVATGLVGGFTQMEIHLLSGYCLLGLVIFRVVWGVIGYGYSRFSQFVKGPRKIVSYLKGGFLQEENPSSLLPGHNPLGALSIILMLILVFLQAVTGLFSNDDIMTEGPLVHLVSEKTSNLLSEWHEINFFLLAIMVLLHLVAIGWYSLIKKKPMIKTMITGYSAETGSELPETSHKSFNITQKSLWLRFILAAGFSTATVYALVNWL